MQRSHLSNDVETPRVRPDSLHQIFIELGLMALGETARLRLERRSFGNHVVLDVVP